MEDKIIIVIVKDGMVRIIVGIIIDLVNEGIKLYDCILVVSVVFGRMLIVGVLIGIILKSNKEVIILKINGNGEINGIIVIVYNDGIVKGVIGNLYIDRFFNEKGKLDVGGVVGINGMLYVIKDLGLKDFYVG